MNNVPAGKKGIARIWAAFFYSLGGLRQAVTREAAFRQEVILYITLLFILFFLPVSTLFKCLLLSVNTLVLIVELLNSSIESVVDMVSPEYHILAKQAKDYGSAAVLLSLLLAGVIWAFTLYKIF